MSKQPIDPPPDPASEFSKREERRKRQQEHARRVLAPYRFKKGQSGNPAGKPKRRPLTNAYRQLLDMTINGRSGAQAVAEQVMARALKGDMPAVKEMTDRVEGTVKMAMDILFGELTNEQLAEFIQQEFANEIAGLAGGQATRDSAPSDPADGSTPQDPDDSA